MDFTSRLNRYGVGLIKDYFGSNSKRRLSLRIFYLITVINKISFWEISVIRSGTVM